NWFKKFRADNFELKDEDRSGRPATTDTDIIKTVLTENPRYSVREIVDATNIPKKTVHKHLIKIEYANRYEVWVPHLLTETGLMNRVSTCLGLGLEILGYDYDCVRKKNEGFEEANRGEIRERISRHQDVEIQRIARDRLIKKKINATNQDTAWTWQTQTHKKKPGYKKFLSLTDILLVLEQNKTFRNGQITPEPLPEFLAPLENHTVIQGRDVFFTCVVNNLHSYKGTQPRLQYKHSHDVDPGYSIGRAMRQSSKASHGPDHRQHPLSDSLRGKDITRVTVAWMKSDSRAILAIHTHLIAHNPRLSVTHNGHNTWKLHVSDVQKNDSGAYMCQVNTEPMRSQVSQNYTLKVISIYMTF
ncbi:Histone-lysine N-methyltransferase SETMAR, partial [Melipona quadrifasciata]